jgi:hypothetical protein
MSSHKFYDDYWKSGGHADMKWTQQRLEEVLGPLIGREAVLDYVCGVGQKYRKPLMVANEDRVANPFNGVHNRYFSAWSHKKLLLMTGFQEIRIDSYIRGSDWDVFRVLGPLSRVTSFANRHFPDVLRLRFLSDLFYELFAERIRVVCSKPH